MLLDILRDFSAFFELTAFHLVTWRMIVMWGVCGLLFYLAVGRGFEPLLLVPIAFGALLANLVSVVLLIGETLRQAR
jgi:oxaloacetate decarboxylase beta subunit